MIVFYHIAFYIPLLAGLLSLAVWKNMNQTEKYFGLMVWSIILISFSGRLWSVFVMDNNLPFFHSYILVEYVFLILLFSRAFREDWRQLKWLVLIIGFALLWVLNAFILSSLWIYPDYIHALEALIILTLVVLWFRKMLREKSIRNPVKNFQFWLCTGLLIYFSGNFLLFVFSNFVIELETRVYEAIWVVHAILVILLYLIYANALLCIPRTKK